MKTLCYSLFVALIFIAGNSVAYAAQDEHAIEVEQHLE